MAHEDKKTVEIRTKVSNGIPFYSDRSRLTIVLNNLISNAIRYRNPAEENQFVDVDVTVSKAGANIFIADNGIGIAPEHQEKIFEMFYRVSQRSMGSGLGLYIVKEAVDKLNGSVQVSSDVGKGSKFILYIPTASIN